MDEAIATEIPGKHCITRSAPVPCSRSTRSVPKSALISEASLGDVSFRSAAMIPRHSRLLKTGQPRGV